MVKIFVTDVGYGKSLGDAAAEQEKKIQEWRESEDDDVEVVIRQATSQFVENHLITTVVYDYE